MDRGRAGEEDFDLDLEVDLKAHRPPWGSTMAFLTTQHIGQPCKMDALLGPSIALIGKTLLVPYVRSSSQKTAMTRQPPEKSSTEPSSMPGNGYVSTRGMPKPWATSPRAFTYSLGKGSAHPMLCCAWAYKSGQEHPKAST